ncbi:MAG: hypothetical protein LEGION0403_FIIPPAGN_01791 [Legionella sp.]|uniref:hypothetical protein n=1 Tax=Legionella sp. TaxID=459 RepID=UPI003D145144
MIKKLCSTPFVIAITIILLITYNQTGAAIANPHNALAPATEYLKSLVHGAIFPTIFLYWTASFLINWF